MKLERKEGETMKEFIVKRTRVIVEHCYVMAEDWEDAEAVAIEADQWEHSHSNDSYEAEENEDE